MTILVVFPLSPQDLLFGRKKTVIFSHFCELLQEPLSHFIFTLNSTDDFSNFKTRQIKYDAEHCPLYLQYSNTVSFKVDCLCHQDMFTV